MLKFWVRFLYIYFQNRKSSIQMNLSDSQSLLGCCFLTISAATLCGVVWSIFFHHFKAMQSGPNSPFQLSWFPFFQRILLANKREPLLPHGCIMPATFGKFLLPWMPPLTHSSHASLSSSPLSILDEIFPVLPTSLQEALFQSIMLSHCLRMPPGTRLFLSLTILRPPEGWPLLFVH